MMHAVQSLTSDRRAFHTSWEVTSCEVAGVPTNSDHTARVCDPLGSNGRIASGSAPDQTGISRTVSTPTTDAVAPATAAASGDAKKPPPPLVPSTTSAERLALAKQHGLRPLNVRPPAGRVHP